MVILCRIQILCIAIIHITSARLTVSSADTEANSSCPLWYWFNKRSGHCECCTTKIYTGINECQTTNLEVAHGHCMTWNNVTKDIKVGRCLFIYRDKRHMLCDYYNHGDHKLVYRIPTNISGPELNRFMCSGYNREGAQCRQCIEGYGPALFSDGVTCADCSKHRYHWILYFIFQLSMVTIMYLAVVLFEINGTASPFNVIITYSQLSVNGIKVGSGLYVTLACNLSRKFPQYFLTLFGIWNLDFFRLALPPVCISTFIKAIDILLFDYIIAFFPLLITIFVLVGIELYDRNCRVAVIISTPLKLVCRKRNWNPKRAILKTCATFLLLSYSKILFVSINLIFAVPLYDCSGSSISDNTVLLFDPSVTLFHSNHIPYVILALSIIAVFVVLPPLLLLLYPTRVFRACLSFMGFRRWDILHLVMDVFQGWFKDKTENQVDCRSFSALYMLLRILFALVSIPIVLNIVNNYYWSFIGVFHVLLGALFLTIKPYKKKWMNHADGLFLFTLGALMITKDSGEKFTFILGAVIVALVTASALLYFICTWATKCKN